MGVHGGGEGILTRVKGKASEEKDLPGTSSFTLDQGDIKSRRLQNAP